MTLKDAMNVLGIEDLLLEEDNTIKEKYHKLMKKYHPDNASGDLDMTVKIRDSYDLVMQAMPDIKVIRALEKEEQHSKKVILLTLQQLASIYKNGSEVVNNENITKHDVAACRTFVIVESNIITTTEQLYNIDKIIAKNASDVYNIEQSIFVDSLIEEPSVIWYINGKSVNFQLSAQSINYTIRLDGGIKVVLTAKKKLKK